LRWIARNFLAASPIESMAISIGSSQMFCAQATGRGGPVAISSRSWANSISPSSCLSSAANPSAAR
jgi:hypothetical protein